MVTKKIKKEEMAQDDCQSERFSSNCCRPSRLRCRWSGCSQGSGSGVRLSGPQPNQSISVGQGRIASASEGSIAPASRVSERQKDRLDLQRVTVHGLATTSGVEVRQPLITHGVLPHGERGTSAVDLDGKKDHRFRDVLQEEAVHTMAAACGVDGK